MGSLFCCWPQSSQLAGHGTTASAYSFADAGVATQATGPVYYRLRQVDTDGTTTYSPQRTVSSLQVATAGLGLFPNPVQSRTTLDLRTLAAACSWSPAPSPTAPCASKPCA